MSESLFKDSFAKAHQCVIDQEFEEIWRRHSPVMSLAGIKDLTRVISAIDTSYKDP